MKKKVDKKEWKIDTSIMENLLSSTALIVNQSYYGLKAAKCKIPRELSVLKRYEEVVLMNYGVELKKYPGDREKLRGLASDVYIGIRSAES